MLINKILINKCKQVFTNKVIYQLKLTNTYYFVFSKNYCVMCDMGMHLVVPIAHTIFTMYCIHFRHYKNAGFIYTVL